MHPLSSTLELSIMLLFILVNSRPYTGMHKSTHCLLLNVIAFIFASLSLFKWSTRVCNASCCVRNFQKGFQELMIPVAKMAF